MWELGGILSLWTPLFSGRFFFWLSQLIGIYVSKLLVLKNSSTITVIVVFSISKLVFDSCFWLLHIRKLSTCIVNAYIYVFDLEWMCTFVYIWWIIEEKLKYLNVLSLSSCYHLCVILMHIWRCLTQLIGCWKCLRMTIIPHYQHCKG